MHFISSYNSSFNLIDDKKVAKSANTNQIPFNIFYSSEKMKDYSLTYLHEMWKIKYNMNSIEYCNKVSSEM